MFPNLYRSVLSVFCAALAALIVQAAASPAAAQMPTCHVLIFADTNDLLIGKSVLTDSYSVANAFRRNVPARQLRIRTYTGSSLSSSRMIRAIETYRLGRNDTLIVYFGGHGAYDPRQGHYMKARDKNVLRSRVRSAMRRPRARLRVLLTDCCNVMQRLNANMDFSMQKQRPVTKTSPAFITLCWKATGFVDLNAASRGEVAMGDDKLGGFFTTSLTSYLHQNRNNRNLSWSRLYSDVRARTRSKFKSRFPNGYTLRSGGRRRTQRSQTPTARLQMGPPVSSVAGYPNSGSLVNVNYPPKPVRPPSQPTRPLRLGVRVRQVGDRVYVIGVYGNSPATRVRTRSGSTGRLEAGDRIVWVNGRMIRSTRDFARAIDYSSRNMHFEIVNRRDGRRYELWATLAR